MTYRSAELIVRRQKLTVNVGQHSEIVLILEGNAVINWGQLGLLLGVGAINARKVYDQLSPESKAKLADIVRWGVRQAASYALNNVLGDVGNQVINQVINDPKVADVAKTLVKRGIEVGVEKALSEANLS